MTTQTARSTAILLLSSIAIFSGAAPLIPAPRAESCGHAHNDYEHQRPLTDALSHGFCSVEADVHLVDGQLLVAHDLEDATPSRTLENLYLKPLLERFGGQKTVDAAKPIVLLVDIKSEADSTYEALRSVLPKYAAILTRFKNNQTLTNTVTVILSGNRPWRLMETETLRYAALDGRLPDLDRNLSPALVPLISDHWGRHFTWTGGGPMPKDEEEKLRDIVNRARERGHKLRFWATPEEARVWQKLATAGVDFINTDQLAELALFLTNAGRAHSDHAETP